ncbi:MAG: helix-turn-helix transcriptional regulator [Clostridiales bacterium]|nr:helix-turn-helix transcriptional regulator [Clostridiales bacterium]
MLYELDYDIKKFGEILLAIRKKGKMTQKQIRELSGIHPDTMKSLEYGLRFPSIDTVNKLSDLYQINLLNVLNECRFDKNDFLVSINSKIDMISYSDDLKEIDEVIDSLNNYIKDNIENFTDRILSKIRQMELLSKLIKIKNKTDIMNINLTEELCIQAIQLTHPGFNISQVHKNYYSLLEYRILLIYSFCMTRQKKHQLALDTTQFILKNLNYHYKSNQSAVKLILLGLFFQSYQLFIMDDNAEVINTCNTGIQMSKEKYCMKYLPTFYFRKGISEYKSNNTSYTETLKNCLETLKLLDNQEMHDKYLSVLNNKYSIHL